jgi:cytochrome c peroxidase
MNPAYVIDSTFRDEGLATNSNIDSADLATERGKFKVPSLRNIELTAPYMHNGVYETLDEVITHYDIVVADSFHVAEINENIASELNPFSDMGLGISTQEKTDLINFMKTLTDGYM